MWLKIEADLDSKLKISWGSNAGIYPLFYKVGADAVRVRAEQLRLELSALAKWSLTKGPGQPVAPHPTMVRLATLGSKLHFLLFNDPDKCREIGELKTWINDEFEGGDHQLTIQADSSIHVPWGLVFDGRVPTLADSAAEPGEQLAQYGGFWCLKYHLSAHQRGFVRSRAKMRRDRSSFGLLSLVNPEVTAKFTSAEYSDFVEILHPPLGVANDLERCQHLLNTESQADILLYFFGHHKDATLDLGKGNLIDFESFSELMDSLNTRSAVQGGSCCSLVFLNACESAVGKADVSIRSATVRPALCGAIATESLVPRKYAAKFGRRFLEALTRQGKSVADAMYELQHDPQLWPESLFYGCYAHPDYRIEPPQPSASTGSISPIEPQLSAALPS
jgi:hypothetical protein